MSQSLGSKIIEANAAIMVEGNLDAVADYFTADHVTHLTDEDVAGGHNAIRRVVGVYRRSFSDLKVEVEILVETDDRVAWQRTLRAIHKGNFKGFPATGRPIVWRDMVVSKFRDGLIAED